MNMQQQVTAQPLFDPDVLARLKRDIGEKNFERVFGLFLKDTPAAAKELRRLLHMGNIKSVQALAYTLKRTCQECGATRSAYAAGQLGDACLARKQTDVIELVDAVIDSLNDLVAAFDKNKSDVIRDPRGWDRLSRVCKCDFAFCDAIYAN